MSKVLSPRGFESMNRMVGCVQQMLRIVCSGRLFICVSQGLFHESEVFRRVSGVRG